MSIFDQRGQKVAYQYNAAGNINFGDIQARDNVPGELQKLLTEIQSATKAGILSEETGIDIEAKIKQAVIQSKKTKPDKKTIMEYLLEAKALIEGIASAAGLVSGLIQAVEMVKRLF